MNLLTDIKNWLLAQGHHAPFTSVPLGGGCICDSNLVTTADGQEYFIKSKPHAPPDLFIAEAAGLQAIAATNAIETPKVYHATRHFLILEYIPSSSKNSDYWSCFAQQLAAMHQQTKPKFGFTLDNYCGETPQINPIMQDGHEFFAQHRLAYQAMLAQEKGLLSRSEVRAVTAVGERLPELIPAQPACLLHGDLWSGNAHAGHSGEPMLIDPACYWGWAEADIAMTRLFGGFPERFYREYVNFHPLDSGWESRIEIYNLYHLLNHLNLFGVSYHAQAISILKRYQ
jgi:fructosamine-3-kinase